MKEEELIRRSLENDETRVHLDPYKLREIRERNGGHDIEKWARQHKVSSSWLINKIEWIHDRRYVEVRRAEKYTESIGIPLRDCLRSYKLEGETLYTDGAYFPDIPPQLRPHIRHLAALTMADDGHMDNAKDDKVCLRVSLEAHAALHYREKKLRKEYVNKKRHPNAIFHIALGLAVGVEMATLAPKDIATAGAEEEVGLPLGLTPNGFKGCENCVSRLLDGFEVDLNLENRSVGNIISQCKDLLVEAKRDRQAVNPWTPERDLDRDASRELDYLLLKLRNISGLNAATVYDLAIEISYGSVLASRIRGSVFDANHPFHMEQLLELDQDVVNIVERAKKLSERDQETE